MVSPLFNITQMNDACCFEEDVEHAFRLKPVASYYGYWSFTFTNPTCFSRLLSNLSYHIVSYHIASMSRFWIGINFPNMLQLYPYDFDRLIRGVSNVMLVFFFKERCE